MKKYKLSKKETIVHNGHTLHRIIYNDGTKGGWIESCDNLSQEGKCSVMFDAKVYGNAFICNDAIAVGNAEIYDNARIHGNSIIGGNTKVYGNACVNDNCIISGNAKIYGSASISDRVRVSDNVTICDNAEVFGRVCIRGYVKIFGNAKVHGSLDLCGYHRIGGCSDLYGSNVMIEGGAKILKNNDYLSFKEWWRSDGGEVIWTREDDKWHIGDFHGNARQMVDNVGGENEFLRKQLMKMIEYVEYVKNETINKL